MMQVHASIASRGIGHLIDELDAADLTISHLLESLQHTLKAIWANLGRMRLELAFGEQRLAQRHPFLRELEVISLGWELVASDFLVLSKSGVRKGLRGGYVVSGRNSVQDIAVLRARAAAESVGAEFGRPEFANAVEGVQQLVFGVFTNFAWRTGVLVIEDCDSAKALHEIEVVGGAHRNGGEARPSTTQSDISQDRQRAG